MSHVGLILQITSIRINMFKVCLGINLNKKTVDNLVKNYSRHNRHLRWIRANSNTPFFRGRLLPYVDTGRTLIREDKLRVQIGLFISDKYCCVMTRS